MATKRSVVTLPEEERAQLLALTQKGRITARRLPRAHILLQADAGATQDTIAAALHSGRATVGRICKRWVEEGLEAALQDHPRPGAQRKLDGKQAAVLMALACSPPPAGRTSWTMQLLADRRIERRVVEAISDETVRRRLRKPS
jgi:transposase